MDVKDSPSGKRAAVVINPTKNPDDDLKDRFFVLCEDLGWSEPLWLETTEEDPGQGQTKQALEAEVDVVIAAGGDGTVRSVASVLTDTDTPWGLCRWEREICWLAMLGFPLTIPSRPQLTS